MGAGCVGANTEKKIDVKITDDVSAVSSTIKKTVIFSDVENKFNILTEQGCEKYLKVTQSDKKEKASYIVSLPLAKNWNGELITYKIMSEDEYASAQSSASVILLGAPLVLDNGFLLLGNGIMDRPLPNELPLQCRVYREKFSIATQINQSLKNHSTIGEIVKPNLVLPPDVNANQITKYFKMDDIQFALVLRNSMNIQQPVPIDFKPSFVGILVAGQNDKQWSKLLEVKDIDVNVSSENNPYYLFIENEKLLLTIVDQNGAGSGEGNMKVFALSEKVGWKLQGCYYYSGVTIKAPINSDSYSFTANLNKQDRQPIETCINKVNLISYD